MNVFVAGWSSRRAPDPLLARATLSAFHGALPFLPGASVRSWQASSGAFAAAWVADEERYAGAEGDQLVLWAGRPMRWDTAGRGEGDSPLDPGFYLPPAHHWAPALDGRFAALRYDDSGRALEVVADALGAYPLYRTELDGVTWVSNRAEPLRALSGSRTVNLDALASLLGGGWSLGGRPVWSAVRRLEPGIWTLHPQEGERRTDLLPAAATAAMCGAGMDPVGAAATLIDSVRALARWPGRPSIVPVTAGRDSRLVLAAALRAGIDFEAMTGGAPDSPDVLGAAELCRAAGIAHHLAPPDPHGDPWSATAEAARILGLGTSGTASLGDAAGFPLGPRPGPPVLWHTGQGGEIARAYYRAAAGADRDAVVAGLERVFCGRRVGRSEPLSEAGRASVRAAIEAWADARLAAGAGVEDLPDLFYLDERMGSWAGPTHGAVEWVQDSTAPLWSSRLLAQMLGGSPEQRAAEAFHDAVLRELAPELADVPYAASPKGGWRHKARRAAQEARRRIAPAPDGPGGPDPFEAVVARTRMAATDHPGHVAWQVLDRDRVGRLLSSPASALDEMNRHYVWRLATVFLDPALEGV